MHRIVSIAASALLGAAFLVAGCTCGDKCCSPAMDSAASKAKVAIARVKPSAASATQPSQGKVTGTVTFTQEDDTLRVSVDLSGFPPNTDHGFHIHEFGDLSAADLSSAGGHFNPTHEHHGGPESAHHHAGDLGNIHADDHGNVKVELTFKNKNLQFTTGPTGILGRSVIVHVHADDLTSDPAGNSGTRVAGGVIEAQ